LLLGVVEFGREKADNLLLLFRVRGEDNAVGPHFDRTFHEHTLEVRAALESSFAMVSSLSAGADTSERQVGVGHLHGDLVDNKSSSSHSIFA